MSLLAYQLNKLVGRYYLKVHKAESAHRNTQLPTAVIAKQTQQYERIKLKFPSLSRWCRGAGAHLPSASGAAPLSPGGEVTPCLLLVSAEQHCALGEI